MADEGVDLIVTSGGLGPTADDLTVEMVAALHRARRWCSTTELEEQIAEILQAADGALQPPRPRRRARPPTASRRWCPEGADVIDPVGTAPGRRGAAATADGRGAAGPAARAPARCGRTAVETEAFREAIAGRTDVPAGDAAAVRASRSPRSPRRCGWPRRASTASTARDHHLPAPRRGGGGHALRAAGAAPEYEELLVLLRERHGRRSSPSDGSTHRRSGRRAARRAPDRAAESCTGGLLAGAAHRAAGVVRVRGGRRGGLLERGQDRPARRRSGLIEHHGAVSRAGRRGDGRRRAARASRPTPRWRSPASRGPAAAPRTSRSATSAGASRRGRPRDHPRPPPAGRPRRHPRPLDHGRDAPAAPGPVEAPRPKLPKRRRQPEAGVSGPRARMFVALDLPEDARDLLSGGATRSLQPAPTCARCARGASRDARVPRVAGRVRRRPDRRRRVRRAAGRAAAAPADARRGEAGPAAQRAPVRARPRGRGRPGGALQAAASDALEAAASTGPRSGPSGLTSRSRG